jgi:hypothetical protein
VPALALGLLCCFELLLFLLPGFASVIACRAWKIRGIDALAATVIFSAAYGYAAFWIYFFSKPGGQIFSWTLILASIACVIWLRRRAASLLDSDFRTPLAYTLILGVFYLSLLYLFVNPLQGGVDVANVRFFPATRPGDNLIPFIFAERIYDRASVRPFCCGDWLSSDRPPLQAGIFLLQRPLRAFGNTGLQYQVLGTILQCLWVCGVWVFLRALGWRRRAVTQAVALLAFGGFVFYNSVYVWPKLLAAAFILLTFAIAARALIGRRTLSTQELLVATVSFVLAILAHPGSIFSFPAMAALLIVRRPLVTWKHAGVATLICVLAFVPWMLYQKLYDPPGNRLLKMHLARVMQPDKRGTVQAIIDAYGHAGLPRVVANKASNFETLAGLGTSWRGLRVEEREYLAFAAGLLLPGGLLAFKLRSKLPYAGAVLAAAAVNLFVWSLALFGPAQTVTEHGSYADLLLISLVCAGFIVAAPRAIYFAALALQILNLVLVWVLFRPGSFVLPTRAIAQPVLQWPMLILTLITGGALLFRFVSAATVADALVEQEPK